MEIALIIVGGLVLLTGVASFFDYLGKRKSSQNSELIERVATLEKEVATLKSGEAEGEGRIAKLESELGFMTKLLEDRKS